MSIRYSYASPKQTTFRHPSGIYRSVPTNCRDREDDARSRDLRIFGGEEGESEESDLRGPMLDVVLGLFDGVDYDDAMC